MKKYIHHVHDKSYKDLYSKKEIALDLFQNMLKTSWSKNLKVEDLSLLDKSFVTADYDELESDIIYKAKINDEDVFIYILLEFQSSVDYTMPIRLLFYISEILRYHCVNAKHQKHDKNIKIPPVIPIVLYNGTQVWDVNTEFRKIISNEEIFDEGLINFKYNVLDINNKFSKDELVENKNVTSIIFLLDQKIEAMEFINRILAIARFFDNLSDTEKKAIKHWIKNSVEDEIANTAINILNEKEEDRMMVSQNAYIFTEYKQKMREEGVKIGIEQGIEQGIEKGIEQGLIQGKRMDILEELNELGEISKELEEKINDENDLNILKSWFKLILKCESIEEFENNIK